MGNLIPESLVWLNQIEGLKGQTTIERRAELKKDYNLSKSQITNLLAVKACFDQPAFDKVRQAEKANPVFILSLNSVMALAGLKDRVDDLSGALHAALDVTLARRLATKHIKNLVEWIVSGKPASEFDPKAKPPKKGIKKDKTEEETGENKIDNPGKTTLDLKKIRQLLEKAEAERIQGKGTTAQDNLVAYLRKILGSSPSKTDKDTLAGEGISETVLLDWLADINLFKKIQSKRKKGKSLTAGELFFLVGHKCLEILGHVARFLLKLVKPFLKFLHLILKLVIDALKELGLYKYAKAIFTLVMVVAAIWFAWEAFHYGVLRPMEMVWSKVHFTHVAEESPTPVPIPPPTVSETVRSLELGSAKLKTSNSSLRTNHSTPIASYQPAVSFNTTASPLNPTATLYDPKILDSEIQSLPANYVVVKDYPMTPDESMPGDVAVSRMQDLIDPDKYTMLIGSGKQTISIANPTHTTLTIYFKSADLFGPLGGSKSPMNFLWEDVKYIHANEIDVETKNPSVIYQCSLVVSGFKYPLTIQCATAADLEHLVSTMQYFIRSFRLAHDTALGGMPYLHQGLILNNECVVEKLWANSLAANGGLQLGDHLWSVGKETRDPQEKKAFEIGLSSLPVILFVSSDSDWNKALIAKNSGMVTTFRPKLRKVVLTH